MPERRRLRRGEIIGERVDREVTDEAEDFLRCPTCGGYVDIRDLAVLLEHEGPLPHPAEDGGSRDLVNRAALHCDRSPEPCHCRLGSHGT